MHFVNCQTFSESEKVNKMIGDILLKTEIKNSVPIQHFMKDRVKDVELKTIEKDKNLFNQDITPHSRDHTKILHFQDLLSLPEYNYIEPLKSDWHDVNDGYFKLSTEDNYITRTADNDVNIYDHNLKPSFKSSHENLIDTPYKWDKKSDEPITWNNIQEPDFEITTHYDVTLYTEKNLNLYKYHFLNDDLIMKYKDKLPQNKDTEPKELTFQEMKYSNVKPTTELYDPTILSESSRNLFDHNSNLSSEQKNNSGKYFEFQKYNNPTLFTWDTKHTDYHMPTKSDYNSETTEWYVRPNEPTKSHSSSEPGEKNLFYGNNDNFPVPTLISYIKKAHPGIVTKKCTVTTNEKEQNISGHVPPENHQNNCHSKITITIIAQNLEHPVNVSKILSQEYNKPLTSEDKTESTTHHTTKTKENPEHSLSECIKNPFEITVIHEKHSDDNHQTHDDSKTGISDDEGVLEQEAKAACKKEHEKCCKQCTSEKNHINAKVTFKDRKIQNVDASSEYFAKTYIIQNKNKLNVFESDRQKLSDVLFKSGRKYTQSTKFASNERKQPNTHSTEHQFKTKTTEKLNELKHEGIHNNMKDVPSENENKNERPTKYSWNGRIHSDDELTSETNIYDSRSSVNDDQNSESAVKKDNRISSPNYLRLKDIISDFDRLTISHVQESGPPWKSYTDNIFMKLKTNYKQNTKSTHTSREMVTVTQSMMQPTNNNPWHHDAVFSKMFNVESTESPLATLMNKMQYSKNPTYPDLSHSKIFYLDTTEKSLPNTLPAPSTTSHFNNYALNPDSHPKIFYEGSAQKAFKEFTADTTELAPLSSQWMDLSINQGVLVTTDVPIRKIIHKENMDINVPNMATPLGDSYKMLLETGTTTTEKQSVFDDDGNLTDNVEPTFASTQVTAKQWGLLNSMEERVDRIPNYVKDSFEDVVKKIADDLAPNLAKKKPLRNNIFEKDVIMKRVTNISLINRTYTKPSHRITTITIEGIPKSKLVTYNKPKYWSNFPTHKALKTTLRTSHPVADHRHKTVTSKSKFSTHTNKKIFVKTTSAIRSDNGNNVKYGMLEKWRNEIYLHPNDLQKANMVKHHSTEPKLPDQKMKIDDLYKEIMRKYENITPFQRKHITVASAANDYKDTQKETKSFNDQENDLTKMEQKDNLSQNQHDVNTFKHNTIDNDINGLYKEIMQLHGIIPTNEEHTITTDAFGDPYIGEFGGNQAPTEIVHKDLSLDVNVINTENPFTPKTPITNKLPEDANVPQEVFEPYTPKTENEVSENHQDTSVFKEFNDLYKDIMEKYENLTSMSTEDMSKTKKLQKKIMKLKNSNWERFKKFFVKKPLSAF